METHQQVAKAWADQIDKHHDGHHMFWIGDSIFSYGHHFKIARIYTLAERKVALFTTRKYSSSTGRHQSYARSAWGYDKPHPQFTVPHIDIHGSGAMEHTANVGHMIQSVLDCIATAKRARLYKTAHLNDALTNLTSAQDYCRAFGLDWPTMRTPFPASAPQLTRAAIMRIAVDSSPELAAALMPFCVEG